MKKHKRNPAAETLLDAMSGLRTAARLAESGGVLDALSSTFEAVATVERAQAELVAALRARGVTWFTIGEQFGITRQAAQQRFGR